MKKTLIAMAVLVSGAAMAQSSVTMYGVAGVSYGDYTTTAANVKTKETGLSSNGLSGNRFGVRGTQDLSNGLKGNFKLELGYDTVNGNFAKNANGDSGFNRTASVGLSGAFGSVDFGRNYTPIFLMLDEADADGTSDWTTLGVFPGSGVRRNKSITYTTPAMGPLSASVQLSSEKSGGATDSGIGLSGMYKTGPLMVALGYDSQKNGSNNNEKNDGMALGASYELGFAKLFGTIISAKKQANTNINTYTKSSEFNFGVTAPLGVVSVVAGLGRNTAQTTTLGASAAKLNGTDFVLGVNYDLAKTTTTYARINRVGTLGNDNTKGVAVGLRHRF